MEQNDSSQAFGAPLVPSVLFSLPQPLSSVLKPRSPPLTPCLHCPGSWSRAGPPSSFLPSFLGTETQLGVGGAGQGRGFSNHPATQSESAPMSPPIPREPGPQREVDKWGGSLGWPKSSGHSRLGHPLLAIPSSPLMARSKNTMLPASAPGASPQNLHRGLVQVRSGGVGAEPDCRDPSLSSVSGKGQGTWGCLCLQDGPQATMGAFLYWGW